MMLRNNGAEDGIRTRDLRFTKPLLYQLSYVGGKRAKHCIQRQFTQARTVVASLREAIDGAALMLMHELFPS